MLFMEFRQLGHSGFKVPVLSFGTGTFGGSSEFFRAWGDTDVKDATRLVDRIITRDMQKVGVGQVIYTPWCDEHGKGLFARLQRIFSNTHGMLGYFRGGPNYG